MKIPKQVVSIFLLGASTVCWANSSYLCRSDERVVFGCEAGKKMISICGSRDFTATTGYVQYRYGTPNKIELSYPSTPVPSHGHFWSSSAMYSGGGETRIRFENEGVQYLVYEATIRTRFDGGPNQPETPVGVSVKIKGKKAARKMCTNDGGFRTNDYERLDKEDFNYDYNP